MRPSIKDVGRYLVKVVCDKGSEAMYFDATFSKHIHTSCLLSPVCDTSIHNAPSKPTAQAPSAGKLITATAFPSKTSAYVSFSSSERAVQFTCQLDQGEDEECEFHII